MASNNDNLLEQLIEAENSHDIEKMLTLMTDDVVIEDVPFGMVMKGKDGVKQGFTGFFTAAADFKVEPKSWVTNDRSFALEVIFTGTQPEPFLVCLRRGKASLSEDAVLENLKTEK
jgi:steroid delta-isomerase-like uncharacterized protein